MNCVVCVTVARSFACAPRREVALVGFVSTERSLPRHGNPFYFSGTGHMRIDEAP